MAAKIRISDIRYLKKPVKDYQKPFRFTLTLSWEDERGDLHGCDIRGCIGGVGKDGRAEWKGPMHWAGRKAAYTVFFEAGTINAVHARLAEAGYFKVKLEDLIPKWKETLPVTAEEEYGLPNELEVS